MTNSFALCRLVNHVLFLAARVYVAKFVGILLFASEWNEPNVERCTYYIGVFVVLVKQFLFLDLEVYSIFSLTS